MGNSSKKVLQDCKTRTVSLQAPLRLSDMLKRKRVSNKRPSNRKGRQHSEGDLTAAAPTTAAAAATPSTSSAHAHLGPSSQSPGGGGGASAAVAATATAYDLYGSSPPSDLALGPATPSRRSRLADR